MTKQYYTPAIEDLHVGYQCERREYISDEWVPATIRWDESENRTDDITEILYDLSENRIRTPYLTKEDIEGEGWTFKDIIMGDKYRFRFDRKHEIRGEIQKICLLYMARTNHMLISTTGAAEYNLFCGQCPSANELRLIQKLLKIK